MATITSAGTGNFTAGATWVGGVAPGSGDIAVAATGHSVTIDADVTVTSPAMRTSSPRGRGSASSSVSAITPACSIQTTASWLLASVTPWAIVTPPVRCQSS